MRKNTNALVKPKGSKWAPLKPTELSAEEVAAIDARILQEELGEQTLCWLCRKVTQGWKSKCPKASRGIPVEGSEYTTHQGPLGEQYNIRSCPLFEFEYGRPQELATVIGIIGYWTGVTAQSIWRNPEKYVDRHNIICPENRIEIIIPEAAADIENEFDLEWRLINND